MDFFDAVYQRQSVRKYAKEQITDEQLDQIIKAGCAAPVGMAAFKSLKIAAIQDQALLGKIDEAGKKAFGSGGPGPGPSSLFYHAPTLIALFSEEGRMPGIDYANAACVAENMILAATALGLGTVYLFMPNGAFASDPSLAAELGIPESFKPVTSIAVGIPEEPLKARDSGYRIDVVRK
ncbi:MAG: nitroreductase family protein [Eubacteriaceae bacterium]|jgi:nitroreductase|nr:nitroreductase family protein [Eubacteriaceae bacterium]